MRDVKDENADWRESIGQRVAQLEKADELRSGWVEENFKTLAGQISGISEKQDQILRTIRNGGAIGNMRKWVVGITVLNTSLMIAAIGIVVMLVR